MAEERAVDPGSPDAADVVADLRRRIDELDELLVRLLSARAACAFEIGRQKKLLGLEIYQPSREAEVLAHVQKINPGPLDNASMKRLFERVIDEARRLEREAEPGQEDTTAVGDQAGPGGPAGAEAPALQKTDVERGL